MTLPNFLVIGAEKAGTTALHALLARHPGFFMSDPKEPSFFLSEDRRYLDQDLMGLQHSGIMVREEYEQIFAAAEPGQAIGESSPCYLYSPEAVRHIHATIPDVRIIAILRNPAERAFSQFTFNQQRGWEPLSRTFREALALEDERVRNNSMWAFHYTRRGMYSRQLAPYIDAFGDRVRAWAYDDFVSEPTKVAREVCEFLGADVIDLEGASRRHNVTVLPRVGLLSRLLDRPSVAKSAIGGLIPQKLRRAIGARLRRWNSRRPDGDEDAIRSLEPIFEDDVRELSAGILPGARRWLGASAQSGTGSSSTR